MLKLELSVEQTQLVLNALSTLPYAQVVELIGLIKTQAEKQLAEKKEPKK
jgi:hypothetical protein